MAIESLQADTETRGKYEKTVDQERSFANHAAWTFWYEGPVAAIKNLKNRLTAEEIIEADALRMNELKSKGELSSEEREELEWRERGDIFYQSVWKKRSLPNYGGFFASGQKEDERGNRIEGDDGEVERVTGSIFKEVIENIESIEGVLDGRKVSIKRWHYDLSEYELKELDGTAKGREKIADFRAFHYCGDIDGAEIAPEEAERLFNEYFSFAAKRSKEIESLREDKAK